MYTERVASDRFLVFLLLASLIHALVILGIGYEKPEPDKIKKSLAITLVLNPSREPPEKADFLAQENQMGSGTGEKKALPRSQPLPRPAPAGTGQHPERTAETKPHRKTRPRPALVQERSEKKIAADDGEDEEPTPEPRKLSAELLSQQIAEVSTELSRSLATTTRRPKIVYINSVNAHKYKAAAYEHSWQQKIERIGNLNYPEEARRRKLSGSLLLSVGIRPDGSVYSIKVRQSSGYPALDAAAEHIVRMASPFAPFPEALRQEADVLVITRTWRFYNDYRLETGR